MALADTVANPVEAHVDGLGSSMFDRVVGEANSAVVVREDGCGALRVAKIRERLTQRDGFASIEEEGGIFGFRGGGDNGIDAGGKLVHGGIDEVNSPGAQKEDPPAREPAFGSEL